MRFELLAGLLLAICSAGLLNASFFLQHRAVTRMPTLRLHHPIHALRELARSPLWLIAYGGGWVGWGLYILAVRLAPLSLVQSIASGGLPLLALLAHRFGSPTTAQERIAALLGALGVALVCSTLGVRVTSAPAHLSLVVIVVSSGAVVAGVLWGPGRRFIGAGAALGAASGLFYAVADVATKGAVDGTGVVLVPIFLAASAAGFIALQLSFHHGGVLQTAGLSALVTAVGPIAAGVLLYHERLPVGPAGWARASGFGLSVVAAVLLALQRRADPSTPPADPVSV